jgi:hypothetical protein
MPLPTIQLADLGALSKLPPELVLMVIGYLDVPSAAKFTLVNRRAQFLLWSDKDYQLIRYCLFRELFTKVDDPESRDQLRGCSPFTDINYHTLAATIRKPVCEDCNTHEKGTYSLNARTGSYLCYSRCRTDQSVCVIIYVQMIKHHLEQVNTKRLYRLLEGQLISIFIVSHSLFPLYYKPWVQV